MSTSTKPMLDRVEDYNKNVELQNNAYWFGLITGPSCNFDVVSNTYITVLRTDNPCGKTLKWFLSRKEYLNMLKLRDRTYHENGNRKIVKFPYSCLVILGFGPMPVGAYTFTELEEAKKLSEDTELQGATGYNIEFEREELKLRSATQINEQFEAEGLPQMFFKSNTV